MILVDHTLGQDLICSLRLFRCGEHLRLQPAVLRVVLVEELGDRDLILVAQSFDIGDFVHELCGQLREHVVDEVSVNIQV